MRTMHRCQHSTALRPRHTTVQLPVARRWPPLYLGARPWPAAIRPAAEHAASGLLADASPASMAGLRGAVAARQLRVLRALAAAVWPSQPPPPGATTDAQRRFFELSGADVPGVAEEVGARQRARIRSGAAARCGLLRCTCRQMAAASRDLLPLPGRCTRHRPSAAQPSAPHRPRAGALPGCRRSGARPESRGASSACAAPPTAPQLCRAPAPLHPRRWGSSGTG